MKRILFLLLFINQSFIGNGQSGYYAKNGLMVVGAKTIDRGAIINAKKCEIEENNKTIVYSPEEVTEYGFKDGRVYISRIIKINNEEKKVFLERLNRGNLILYYYKDKKGKKFFLENKGGQLVEIFKKKSETLNYKDVLKTYTQDCNNISEALALVTYRKVSLTKFIDQYNYCSHEPFPYVRFGFTIGYSFAKPTNLNVFNEVLKNAVFQTDNSFNVGVFADVPILASDFSFHPGIFFQKNAYSGHSVTDNTENEIIINATSVNLPLVVRYTYPSLKFRPFINIGGTFAYNFRNKNTVYTTTISNDIVEIAEPDNSNLYSEKQMGYTFGGGIQYKIDYKKSIFLELSYTNLFNLRKETLSNKSFQCTLGINF